MVKKKRSNKKKCKEPDLRSLGVLTHDDLIAFKICIPGLTDEKPKNEVIDHDQKPQEMKSIDEWLYED